MAAACPLKGNQWSVRLFVLHALSRSQRFLAYLNLVFLVAYCATLD